MATTITATIIFSIATVQGLFIQRQIDHEQWTTLPDRFQLPQSQCRNVSSYCRSVGATTVPAASCMCECDVASKTLMNFNGEFKCMESDRVKHLTNCPMNVTIDLESGSNIFTIPQEPEVTIEYNATFLDPMSCSPYNIEYMHCNGTWETFPGSPHDVFSISESRTITPLPKIKESILYGKVIKLHLDCTYESNRPRNSFCVLFKIQGSQNCSIISPHKAVIPPRTVATESSTITVADTSSTASPTTSFTTEKTHLKSSATVVQKQSLTQAVTIATLTTTSDSKSMIAGVSSGVGGLLAIAALVVCIIFVLKRRRERRSADKNNSANCHGNVVDTQESLNKEYDYAYSQTPVGIPLPGVNSTVNNRVYGPTSETNTSNNVTESPVYAKPEKTRENKEPCDQDNSVFYHALEGPDNELSNNDPIYNEPEAPCHESQHYRALEGNVPHVYCALIQPSGAQPDRVLEIHGYDSFGSII